MDINLIRSQKPISSYTDEQIKNIKLVSLRKDNLADPFGSATYRIQKYPADLDTNELFIDCCSVDEVISTFEKKIKKIAKNIKKEKLHYFSEFKSGLDLRYDVDVGEIYDGVFVPNQELRNFDPNLLSKKEKDLVMDILSYQTAGGDEYDILFNLFREHRILRWNIDEVIAGKKKLPSGITIKLNDALHIKSHVKIDMITLVNNQFVEITDFYILVSHDLNSDEMTVINLDYDYLDPIEKKLNQDIGLREEIEKLYFSNYYYNPFKCAKRMWAYSRGFGLNDSIRILLPLVSGDISYLYSLASELDTILRIHELKKNPIKYIDNVVDLIKYKLTNILILTEEELLQINKIVELFLKKHDFGVLEKLKKYLKEFVSVFTIDELKKIGYNPPPQQFLPYIMKYAHIIRKPLDIVEMPMIKKKIHRINDFNQLYKLNKERNRSNDYKRLVDLNQERNQSNDYKRHIDLTQGRGGSQQIRRVYFSNENPYTGEEYYSLNGIGGAFADNFISSLPFELHLLGTVHKEPYQSMDESLKNYKEGHMRRMEYAGPGTHIDARFARGERGINDLDHAAMYHDFSYQSTDPDIRNEADDILAYAAREYLKKEGISLLDKTDAQIVITAMKLNHRKPLKGGKSTSIKKNYYDLTFEDDLVEANADLKEGNPSEYDISILKSYNLPNGISKKLYAANMRAYNGVPTKKDIAILKKLKRTYLKLGKKYDEYYEDKTDYLNYLNPVEKFNMFN